MSGDIRLCGEVSVDGDSTGLGGRLALLLAVLALSGERGVRRDELADVLWPENPPAVPSKVLNPLLSRLRRTVGPVDGRGLVRLAPGNGLRVDVLDALADLERAQAVLAGDPAAALVAANRAAGVLAGELLPAHDDAWTATQRARLAARRLEALTLATRAGLAVRGEALPAAERAARALIVAAPLHEAGVGLLMDVLVAQGQEVAALHAYEDLRARLRQELGAAPGQRLRARHEALLRRADASPLALAGLEAPLAAERATALVGRARELAAVHAALDRHDRPRLIVVAGPPGIGKTRLVAEVAARRHASGAAVLVARGRPAPSGPYAAMADALAPAVAQADPDELADALGPLVVDLARLVPALTRRRPVAPVDEPQDADTSRFRMFEAVRTLLAGLDGAAGTLLVLDDAQWLDSSSVPLVTHLLRARGLPSLTVLVTARPAKVGPAGEGAGQTVVSQLRDAVGRGDVVELDLGALGLEPVRELVAASRGAMDHEEEAEIEATARRLHAATGGSPLLLRAALTTGAAADDDLAHAVRSGLTWAGPQVQTVLEVLAVDGGRAGLDVLAAAAEVSLGEAGDRLERARDAGLLVPGDGPSALSTMHDAVRQAILLELGPARRAALHVRLATAYETVCADSLDLVLPEVATHWAGADGPVAAARAAQYGERAARRALAALAYEQAAAHAAGARVAHERAGSPPEELLAVMLLEGEAHNRASALTSARAVLGDALSLARRLGRDDLVARAAIEHVGHRLGAGIQDPPMIAVLEEGWAAVSPEDVVLRARLAGGLGATLIRGPAERRDELARTAVALARTSGDPATIAETLLWQHVGLLWRAAPEERTAAVDEAEAAARTARRPGLALHARMLRFTDLLEAGRIPQARIEMAGWAAEAEATGVPYHRWAAAICRPTLDQLVGDLGGARRALQHAQELAAPLGDSRVVLSAHTAQWFTLRLSEGAAEESAAQLAAVIATQDVPVAWHAGLAWCHAASGDGARARDGVAGVLAGDLDAVVDPNRLTALSFLAQAAVVAGAPVAELERVRAALAPHAGRWIVQHYGGAVHGPVHARLALLDAALGRTDDAQAQLDQASAAIDAAGADGLRPELDYVRVRLALARGRDADAAALAQTGAARAQAMGLAGPARLLAGAIGAPAAAG